MVKYTSGEKTVSFNSQWAASLTFEEFAEHEKHHGLSKKELQEAYDIAVGMHKKKEPAEAPVIEATKDPVPVAAQNEVAPDDTSEAKERPGKKPASTR